MLMACRRSPEVAALPKLIFASDKILATLDSSPEPQFAVPAEQDGRSIRHGAAQKESQVSLSAAELKDLDPAGIYNVNATDRISPHSGWRIELSHPIPRPP